MSRRRASTISGGFDIRRSKAGTKGSHLTFRIAILGAPGVGKTALTVRYTTRRFIGEYDPTLDCCVDLDVGKGPPHGECKVSLVKHG